VHVEATGEQPEHVVVTMVWQEPRPIEFRGDLRFEGVGAIRGELHAE
jgi:hypothetical protein